MFYRVRAGRRSGETGFGAARRADGRDAREGQVVSTLLLAAHAGGHPETVLVLRSVPILFAQ